MAKTQHTIVTNTGSVGIGSSVRTDDGCMIKSTHGTSTWRTHVDHDTIENCMPGNLITADNIDHTITGIYNRTNLLTRFVGDWNSILRFDQSPYYDNSGDLPVFSYSSSIPRNNLVQFFSTKPHGFYYQAVIRFKEPIDIPPKSDIKWWFTPEVHNGSHGGMKGRPGQMLYPGFGAGQGGIYAVDSLNDISTKVVTWKHNTCGGNDVWIPNSPKDDASYVMEHGKTGVTTLISRFIYGGCAGWNKTKFNATLVTCAITTTQKLLVEGRDF